MIDIGLVHLTDIVQVVDIVQKIESNLIADMNQVVGMRFVGIEQRIVFWPLIDLVGIEDQMRSFRCCRKVRCKND